MYNAVSVETASVSPGAGHWIKKLTRALTTRDSHASSDQNPTIEKGCDRAPPAWLVHVAGGCPQAGCRIIGLGARQRPDQVPIAACHQHFTVLQQRRHVFFAA